MRADVRSAIIARTVAGSRLRKGQKGPALQEFMACELFKKDEKPPPTADELHSKLMVAFSRGQKRG